MSGDELIALTNKLLATLKAKNVPAVGFVKERKLYKTGEADARIKTMSMWLDNGFELGNHTFGHSSLNHVPLPVGEEEVVCGVTVTKMLLAGHQQKLRYFRHPNLDTGRDLQTRREADAFLISRGHWIATVTMDAWDWMFGGIDDDAHKRDDKALEDKLTAAHLDHATNVFDYFEKMSRNLFGYEPPQVLLLHTNWLDADHIGVLTEQLGKRGYAFVTLDEALGDGAYSVRDEFVGLEVSGWLEHWAITRGQRRGMSRCFCNG